MNTEKRRGFWTTIKERLKKPPGSAAALRTSLTETVSEDFLIKPDALLARLREFLFDPNEPDARLNPKWLAAKLGAGEREMLDALAYAVRDGLVELHGKFIVRRAERVPLNSARSKKLLVTLIVRRAATISICISTATCA